MSWDELCNFLEEDCQEELHNFGAQLGFRNLWREGWFPYRIVQFPEGAAHPVTNIKSKKEFVKEVEQTCMHRLTRLYETAEAYVLDYARHVAEDGW